MGEIRLTDDDKDRKYRIRVNEDGEEELEIIEQPEEEPEEDYLGFQADDEEDETEDLSKEQEELMRAAREEQARLAREEAQENIDKAKARIEEGDYEFALVALDAAQKAWDEVGEIYTLKLELLTGYFTDFSRLEECVSLQEQYEKFVSEEDKAVLREKYADIVKSNAEKYEAQAEGEQAENESKKAERRERFKARRNKSMRNFLFTLIPFIVVLCAAIGLSTVMFSDKGGVLFVVTIVLFALAAVGLIATIIMLRPFVRDVNRLRINERDTATAIGRAYLESAKKAELFTSLYQMLIYAAPVKEEAEYAVACEDGASAI